MVDFTAIEKKWQQRWYDANLYVSHRGDHQDSKFFIHFAYPGISGFLHVGHMRGFAYADTIARYKRMTGHAVCFPAGFHASGLPAVSLAKKVQRGDEAILHYLRENGCPEKVITRLSDPQEVIRYFSQVYVEDYWKRFGFLIDYSRLMDTVSPGYQRFIQWQFHKLKQAGLLTKKPHFAPFCPNCGPVAVDKSETDISEGGSAEVLEFTVIKFRVEDMILPAATLRPETIFGVTNMWVHPDVEYVIANVDDEKWVLSEEGLHKLANQREKDVEVVDRVKGSELVGKTCTVPLVEREVPILSATFADPAVATGIVMSVPAHAPYDYVALKEAAPDIKPIVIISVEGYEVPAKEVVEEMGITSQQEHAQLEEATQRVYKKEFHQGRLNRRCEHYKDIAVADIKDSVKNELMDSGKATVLREFSLPVICRCGTGVIIKIVPDQWFIRYSDEDLTKTSEAHVKAMNIYPEEYKEELPKVLDWFDDRACIRKGSWLGTEFPFKKGWIIEPISDSTIYPAYYMVAPYVNTGRLQPEELTNDFFDFVFLGKGSPASEIWEEVRSDFLFWYPVDINLGGKEHKTVHFPVFLMNHVAIMEAKHWPRGIFVNWWITQLSGEKISKSKGGAVPIPDAAERYGVDTMRLYYAHIGSPFVDIEWDGSLAATYRKRLARLWDMLHELLNLNGTQKGDIDTWLEAASQRAMNEAQSTMETYELRKAANVIFFDMPNYLQWYRKRGGEHGPTVNKLLSEWLCMMAPFTPHVAEELWEQMGNSDFVTNQRIAEEKNFSREALKKEQLLMNTIEDIQEILKVTNLTPSTIYIYTAQVWKWKVVSIAAKIAAEGCLNVGTVMKEVMAYDDIKQQGKQVSKFAQKVIKEMQRGTDIIPIDEYAYLCNAQGFLEQEFDARVHIFRAEDDVPDPGRKKSKAEPYRPAIYTE